MANDEDHLFMLLSTICISSWEKCVFELLCSFLKWVQLSSVAHKGSYLTVLDPMDCSTPGLPVYHQLPEFTQTHLHRVSDDIQPLHPLSSPSLPAFNLSQHQGLYK